MQPGWQIADEPGRGEFRPGVEAIDDAIFEVAGRAIGHEHGERIPREIHLAAALLGKRECLRAGVRAIEVGIAGPLAGGDEQSREGASRQEPA